MEAKYGKLWETNKESDLEKYHELRKIQPLENVINNKEYKNYDHHGGRKG